MATLILTAVGTALGGPLGGLVGSFLGSAADRRLFGRHAAPGARAADLAVQSSAYGEPIPRIYGRMRVAGAVIWSPGIKEQVAHSGGKSSGGSTRYSYSCSFAVALSSRAIAGVGRIWADGKLLRGADGVFNFPATMRLHLGGEAQLPDPLILAAESVDAAPAFRGIAYAVFEDLPLADYANRIPNLTFEVIADDGAVGVDAIVADVCRTTQIAVPSVVGTMPQLHGFVAAQQGAVRAQLEPLIVLADLQFGDDADGLSMRAGPDPAVWMLAGDDLGAVVPGQTATAAQREQVAPLASLADAISIGYFEPARDYQLGLQRATRRRPVVRVEQQDFAVALDSAAAKSVAVRQLATATARRKTATLHLPWRHTAIPVGATVQVTGETTRWRVRSIDIEGLIVALSLERLPFAGLPLAMSEPGRHVPALDAPAGPTVLHVLDLPPLAGGVPTEPLLWIAAAGPDAGWRGAGLDVSLDGGSSFSALPPIAAPSVLGVAKTVLGAGPADRWDDRNHVEVELINDGLWLEGAPSESVRSGANLALLGDELIQFGFAVALGARRFRLHRLLRGRRATGSAQSTHQLNERFVLLDSSRLVPFAAPLDALGRELHVRASNASGTTAVVVRLEAHALRPLPPAHLMARIGADGSIVVNWIRRSRGGFVWVDGCDAPLAEASEAYRIEIWQSGVRLRTAGVTTPQWTYDTAQQAFDGLGSGDVDIVVQQISAAVGLGTPASLQLSL